VLLPALAELKAAARAAGVTREGIRA